jgi:hypothetical protein
MDAAASHSFRYEPGLCSLAAGETLAEWRRDRHAEGRAAGPARRRRSLRARLGRGRTAAAPQSSR